MLVMCGRGSLQILRVVMSLPGFAAVRVSAAIATANTFFQPDEYWQSLEIAHRIVFGFGYETWEWTRAPPIRSAVHPLMFVPAMWAARASGSLAVLKYAPALTQALLSAAGDLCAYRLAERVGGKPAASFFLVLHTLSFYTLFTASRTFSNTAEAALVAAALSFWPLSPRTASRPRFLAALAAAFTAVLLRPTSLVLWAFLGAWHLAATARRGGPAAAAHTIFDAAWVGALVLGAGAAADSAFYGRPVFTPAAFFRENVVHSVSIFYGTHPWHWYVSQGLPFILTVAAPWVLAGWVRALAGRLPARDPPAVRCLAYACLWMVATYSLLSHKEFRFLQAAVPMLHLFGALALAAAVPHAASAAAAVRALPRTLQVLYAVQAPLAIYALAFHARGQVNIMGYLHERAQTPSMHSLAFLMPCHSTPWQSHLHAPRLEHGRAWFIECPPPAPHDGPLYWDQSDFFYHDPLKYMQERFPETVDASFAAAPPAPKRAHGPPERAIYDRGWQHTWPSHLVVFDALLTPPMQRFLTAKGYREEHRMWNALAHPDSRRRGDIVVLAHAAA